MSEKRPSSVEGFFDMVRERYTIYLKRQRGESWPWTDNGILRMGSFCNVFREDDKTTVWFRENIRDPLRNDPKVLFATVAFRWFNRIETGERIKEWLLGDWDQDAVRKTLEGVAPIVTGAYMIKSPVGYDKLNGVLRCIHFFKPRVAGYLERFPDFSLERAHNELQSAIFLGNFMAYEIATDLRHTYLLENAPDIMTWASFGPGAARGLGRMFHQDIKHYNRTSTRDQKEMLELSKDILEKSKDDNYWHKEWPAWEMREVEHGLCEYDKYERVRLGEGKLKRKYKRK
jgi:hypothetical protein